jgi:hypothetical protein
MNSVSILVEAKNEYTSQLQKILTPRLYEGFKSIYEDIIKILSSELIENKSQGSSIIKTFQKSLKDIPQWNQDMINKEHQRIIQMSNCDYFENLLEAIFITNTKILTSVQINDDRSQNIKINIPQSPHFIHKCYIECSKEIYKNPYIFDLSKGLNPKEKHANLRDSLVLIDSAINNAIRDLLPIRDILSQGLTKLYSNNNEREKEVNEEDDTSSEEEESDLSIEENNEVDENRESIEIDKKEILIDNNPVIIDDEVVEANVDAHVDIAAAPIENISTNDKEIIEIHNEFLENIDNIENESEPGQAPEKPKMIETKEIILNNNNSSNNFKKISSVEKMVTREENNKNEVILNEDLALALSKPRILIESKLPMSKNIINLNNSSPTKKIDYALENINNPFIKNIRNKKFMKNKFYGIDKNNSFYKKKYEENSANFHSVSDGILKEVNSIVSEIKPIKNIIKPQLTSDSILSKVSKNQINLDDNSSVEDDEENIDL